MRKVGGAAALMLLLVGVVYAFAGKGLEKMVLPVEGKYGAVEVPHWEHQQNLEDCNACHGLFPQEEGAIDRLKAEKALKIKEVMNNCRVCHRSLSKEGKASGPVKCFGCHAKG